MVLKGKISDVLNEGTAVTVTPYGGGVVTVALTVPFFLIGALDVNTPVVYTVFEDNTGLILARMDGAGNHDGTDVLEPTDIFARVENGVCTVGCAKSAGDTSAAVVDNVLEIKGG